MKHTVENEDRKKKEKETGIRQPDPETENTTDPQENMKGPFSSFMQGVKHTAEDNDDDDREELKHPTTKTTEDPYRPKNANNK